MMTRCAPSTRVRIPRSKRSIKRRYLANKKTSKKGNKRNTTRRHNRKIRVQTRLHKARNTSKGIGGQGSFLEGGIWDWNYNDHCNICGRTFCLSLRVHQCRQCEKKVCYYCARESTGNTFTGFRKWICICCNIPSFMGELFKFQSWVCRYFRKSDFNTINTHKKNFDAQLSSSSFGTVKQSQIFLSAFYLDAVVSHKQRGVYDTVYVCPYVISCPYREMELRDKHYKSLRTQFHTGLNVFLHTFNQLIDRNIGVAFLVLKSSKMAVHAICIIVNKTSRKLYLFDPNGTWKKYSHAQQSVTTSSNNTKRFVKGERVYVESKSQYGRVIQSIESDNDDLCKGNSVNDSPRNNEKYLIQLDDTKTPTEFYYSELDGQHTVYSYFNKNLDVINRLHNGLNIQSVIHTPQILQESNCSCGLWTTMVAIFSLTGVSFDDIFTYRLYESNMIPIVQQYYDALATLKMDNGTGQSLEAFLNSGKLTKITSPPYLRVNDLKCTQHIDRDALLPPQVKVRNLQFLNSSQRKRLIYLLCWHPHFTVTSDDCDSIEFCLNDWQHSNDVETKISQLETDLNFTNGKFFSADIRDNTHIRKYRIDVLSYPYPPFVITLDIKATTQERSIYINSLENKSESPEYSLLFNHFISNDCEILKKANGRLQKGMALTQIDDTSLRNESFQDVIAHLQTIPFQTMQWEWLQ